MLLWFRLNPAFDTPIRSLLLSKPSRKPLPILFWNWPRRAEVAYLTALIGTSYTGTSLYRFTEIPRICPTCNVFDTVDHRLAICRDFVEQRQALAIMQRPYLDWALHPEYAETNPQFFTFVFHPP